MKYVLYGLLVILFIDVLGFIAWRLSEQKPADSFHAGIITESIIKVL